MSQCDSITHTHRIEIFTWCSIITSSLSSLFKSYRQHFICSSNFSLSFLSTSIPALPNPNLSVHASQWNRTNEKKKFFFRLNFDRNSNKVNTTSSSIHGALSRLRCHWTFGFYFPLLSCVDSNTSTSTPTTVHKMSICNVHYISELKKNRCGKSVHKTKVQKRLLKALRIARTHAQHKWQQQKWEKLQIVENQNWKQCWRKYTRRSTTLESRIKRYRNEERKKSLRTLYFAIRTPRRPTHRTFVPSYFIFYFFFGCVCHFAAHAVGRFCQWCFSFFFFFLLSHRIHFGIARMFICWVVWLAFSSSRQIKQYVNSFLLFLLLLLLILLCTFVWLAHLHLR